VKKGGVKGWGKGRREEDGKEERGKVASWLLEGDRRP